MDDLEIVYDAEAAAGIIRVLLIAAACLTAREVIADVIHRLTRKRGR